MIAFADIIHAQNRLKRYLSPTPLERAAQLPANIWLKLENVNPTHSFKIRGALNAMLQLAPDERARGILAASSGNHGQGVAYAAHLAGAAAHILMPRHTPQRKLNGVRLHGAEAVLVGDTYDEAEAEARRLQHETGRPFISPYNDPHVIAGAGTIGLEIAETLPNVRRVVVPVSGGGLISGIGLAIKTLCPDAEVIGINATSAPAMYNAFYQTSRPQIGDTLAEALSGEIESGSITLPIARAFVDQILLVSEQQTAAAMRWMLLQQGWLIEGGGAVGVAAALHGLLPQDDAPTVLVISGSNVDEANIRQILASPDVKDD